MQNSTQNSAQGATRNKVIKVIVGIVVIFALLFILRALFVLNLEGCLTWSLMSQLKNNLDFIGKFIDRYPWLAAVFAVALTVFILWFLLMRKFSLSSTKVTILGAEFELKQTENKIKAQVKNYLSSKRSVFVFYDGYDNYYDCIKSMYDILKFLRKQLESFESLDHTDNETYTKIEDMVQAIGKFLTAYQSDYRRYYQMELKKHKNDFISFLEIQRRYSKDREMAAAFSELNASMRACACASDSPFKVRIDKWEGWYTNGVVSVTPLPGVPARPEPPYVVSATPASGNGQDAAGRPPHL